MQQKKDRSSRSKYWNSFYATDRTISPSSFAEFVVKKFELPNRIVDLGCGNGRDSIFFYQQGFDVLSVDSSEVAISRLRRFTGSSIKTLKCDLARLSDNSRFRRFVMHPSCLYARFFLHAIEEEEEPFFFEVVDAVLKSPNSMVVCEFRTLLDIKSQKIFMDHARRFVDHNKLLAHLGTKYKIEYVHAGHGLAKFSDEDPHVCRIVFTGSPIT